MAMPRGNGTGPAGMGPMTGRGAGYCAGFRIPGVLNSSPKQGFVLRRGYKRMLWTAGLIPGFAYLAYRWATHNRMK